MVVAESVGRETIDWPDRWRTFSWDGQTGDFDWENTTAHSLVFERVPFPPNPCMPISAPRKQREVPRLGSRLTEALCWT